MFNRLRCWRIPCPDLCVLCSATDETPDHCFKKKTPDHLFFNCSYARELWQSFTDLTKDVVWKIANRSSSTTTDWRIGEKIKSIQRFKRKTTCWGSPLDRACSHRLVSFERTEPEIQGRRIAASLGATETINHGYWFIVLINNLKGFSYL